MKIKTAVILFAIMLTSCSSKNTIYLFTDKYSSEILNSVNIIEEFSRISKKYNYKLHQINADSEADFKSAIDSLEISDKDKVVMSSYLYISFFHNNTEISGKIFVIGPLFDIKRENIEITGNLASVSSESFSGLDTKTVSFYTDDDEGSYPEKEIMSGIKESIGTEEDSLYVTNSSISSVKTGGFRNSSPNGVIVVVPESSLGDVVNRLQDIESPYVLYDFGHFTDLNLFQTVPGPLFTIKYSYKDSFEAAALFNKGNSDRKIIYPAYFEKK